MMNGFVGGESSDKSNDSDTPLELVESSFEFSSVQKLDVGIGINDISTTQGDEKEATENTGQRPCKKVSRQQQLNLQRGTSGSSSSTNLKLSKYDHSRIRELMSHMVMVHELPFTFAENELFNVLMKEASPEFQNISHTTLKADCMTTYQNEKKRLMTLLSSVKRVFLTTDIWHSGQEIEYMLVTCHFVSDWKLHKRVLNFCRIPPPQNGPAICDVLNHCLMDWNLTNKLATITVDSALYNDVAIKKLKDVLSYQRKMPFDGKLFHVRCCAHIVNILVQEVLEEIRDIIHNIRETVKHIGESSHRIKIFGDVVKSWHLPGKKLILDCPTHWNSTYQMLACVLEFKDVFGDYKEKDTSYKNKLLDTEWIKVEKICSFLQIFNDITEIVSGTQYPTSNLFLPELVQIKEELDEKSKSDDSYIQAMANRMKSKFDNCWRSNNLLISISIVLDPRYKFKAIQFCSKSLYESDLEAQEYVSTVRDTLHALYNEYVELCTPVNSGNIGVACQDDGIGPSNVTSVVGKGITRGRRKFDDYIRGLDASQNSKSELDTYLEDGIIRLGDVNDYFDPLDWWKSNSLKFRTLSKLACDILAIPLTSVASESAYSAGSRVIDNYKASLGVDTVQMLLCGEDWLRNLYGIKKKKRTIELEMKEIPF